MKRVITAAATAALVGVWIPTVAADDLISADMVPGKFSANVALTSEYFFRGISQTDDSPAIQGGFDWNHEGTGLYLGVWGSNIDFNTGNSIEIDIYGGIGGTIDKLSWKA
ncbi:MAG TPA: TorF family putative porin, partial [Alphaproteobacteria bacterium]